MPQAKTSLVEALKKVPLFKAFTEEECQFLMQHGLRHHVKADEFIFSEGEACRGLYLIEVGSVKIFASSTGGREQTLATQGPGGTLGELAALDGGNYPASATASTDTDLLFIRREEVQALCLRDPKVAIKLLEVVASRVRPMIGLLEQISFSTVRQRLATLLLQLAAKDGNLTAHGVEFKLRASNRELAAQIGTVPELISRNLGFLQASGSIKIRGKTIIICDPKGLRCEAGN